MPTVREVLFRRSDDQFFHGFDIFRSKIFSFKFTISRRHLINLFSRYTDSKTPLQSASESK